MNRNLNCIYNKGSGIFIWNKESAMIDVSAECVDDLWETVASFNDTKNGNVDALTGMAACKAYVNDLKTEPNADKGALKDSLESFVSLTKHIKDIIVFLCNGHIVTSATICSDYLRQYEQCYELSQTKNPDYIVMANAFAELLDEEAVLLSRMSGLRMINMIKWTEC